MYITFYDKAFAGLQSNAALVIDSKSYKLVKRSVDTDSLTCMCEGFTEDIQPTFLVVKDSRGRYVYGALAGIPELTKDNKTKVTATDIKMLFNSDVILDFDGTLTTVEDVLDYVFAEWNTQVNQASFTVALAYTTEFTVALGDLEPVVTKARYNAWEIIKNYLRYYNLYITSSLDLANKKVIFTVGKAMQADYNIKLWELGVKDYGKWMAALNETQGYVNVDGTWSAGTRWVLRSNNSITTNTALRDIYPIKRSIVVKEATAEDAAEKLTEANMEALEKLTESMFNESIELPMREGVSFETKFNVYARRGGGLYKSLPMGEMHYDANGLVRIQIGYRFQGLEFIL